MKVQRKPGNGAESLEDLIYKMVKIMSANEVKVWLYFMKNSDCWQTYEWDVADIMEQMNMSESTVYRIRKTFIDKGYLTNDGTNMYYFTANPEGV